MSSSSPAPSRALVLGGGGVTGIAWEIGLVHGLVRAGVDLSAADLVVGTSAGSVVGAQLRSGLDLAVLYERQLEPPDGEVAARLTRAMIVRMAVPLLLPGSATTKRARLGRLARRAQPGDGAQRVAVIRDRLPVHEWPAGDLRICAVDADSGEFVVLDRHGEVDLVHAVASSCAVPMVWPTVATAGRRFLDGGFRSVANVDVARDHDRVVVLAPITRSFSRATSIEAQLARTGAAASAVVSPDEDAAEAIGPNVLDPARRAAAARAGLRQADAVLDAVRRAWD